MLYVQNILLQLPLPKQYDDSEFMREFCPYDAAGSAERICRMLYNKEDCCNILRPKQVPVTMFYGELLEPSTPNTQMTQCLQRLKKTESTACYTTGILSGAMRKDADRITKLLPLSRFLSMEPDLYYTPMEVVVHTLTTKRGKQPGIFGFYLKRLYEREYRRNFGDLVFSNIVFCTESDNRYRRIFETAAETNIISYRDGIAKIEDAMNQQ